jgi:hypothetical protein
MRRPMSTIETAPARPQAPEPVGGEGEQSRARYPDGLPKAMSARSCGAG